MSSDSESRVPLRAFVTDSALFGIGAMADKLIAFVFLPDHCRDSRNFRVRRLCAVLDCRDYLVHAVLAWHAERIFSFRD